jgi:hypothetical protein
MSLFEPREHPYRRGGLLLAAVLLVSGIALLAGWYFLYHRAPEPSRAVDPGPERERLDPGREPDEAVDVRPSPERRRAAPADPVARPPAASPAPAPSPPATATLQIETDVPGASVFLNRKYLGTTPHTARNLTPGSYRVNVSKEGYDGYAETIDVEPGSRTLTIRLDQVRLDERIDVIHRHTVGSCEGRLIATTEGLQYLTSHEHAFTMGFGELAVFEIDYLAHNLRITRRGGRTYNFTDHREDADALFVFHRNVEAAMEKLAR